MRAPLTPIFPERLLGSKAEAGLLLSLAALRDPTPCHPCQPLGSCPRPPLQHSGLSHAGGLVQSLLGNVGGVR